MTTRDQQRSDDQGVDHNTDHECEAELPEGAQWAEQTTHAPGFTWWSSFQRMMAGSARVCS